MKKSKFSQMTRREFVLAAPAVAAAACLGGLGRIAPAAAADLKQDSAGRFSIAYLEGSEQWDHLHCLAPTPEGVGGETTMDQARLVPADTLWSGDGSFAERGARVTIHGLLGEAPDNLPEMEMKARYRPFHESQSVLWGFQGSPTHAAQPATSFSAPIDAGTGLELSLELRPRKDRSRETEPETAEARFTPGAAPGQAKLRRGVYLLAWDLSSGSALPDWSRYHAIADRIAKPEEGLPEIRRFMLTDAFGPVKTLPALVMSVDYADQAAI